MKKVTIILIFLLMLLSTISLISASYPRLNTQDSYRVTIVKAQVQATKADGKNWDILGGAPDPFVAVTDSNGRTYRTETRKNNYNPVWNREIILSNAGIGSISVLDEDKDANDLIGTIDNVQGTGSQQLQVGLCTLWIKIERTQQ